MVLSIVVITMNRADQLRSALLSCVKSQLPSEVEFVIVDNASTDNTKQMIEDFFKEYQYPFKYDYQAVNLGVGGGRNRGYELAEGKYVYFLDDDAVIASDSYDSFFIKSIALFEADSHVATITTRIYDELWGCDRDVRVSKQSSKDGVANIFMFLGGSHFLRKKYFLPPLYLEIKYGMEELLPSILVADKGLRNCYLSDIRILHQPRRNKWIPGSNDARDIAIRYNANMYCTKKMLYPNIMAPALFIVFMLRCMIRFGCRLSLYKKSYLMYRNIYNGNKVHKISIRTVMSLARLYSVGAVL